MMDAARPQFKERIGTTLAEKYTLLRLLGVGGMAAVYEAENTWTGRRVAIKLLTADANGDEAHAQRFMTEARAATRVEHPNIVQILDMGRDAQDGTLFIVEEFLTGSDLRAILDERGVLPPRAALEIMVPVMAALAAAHRQSVVHRDIKPANIFLSRGPAGEIVPKVIDFGVVKMDSSEGITKAGTTIGTPEYMSPEQAHGDRSIDAQTDVWSTGVVLYELLTGACPFEHENYHSLLVKILWHDVPRLDEETTTVPKALADVVHKALARDRAERYRNMNEFLDAVLACSAFADEDWLRALTTTYRPSAMASAPDSAGHLASSNSMPSAGPNTDPEGVEATARRSSVRPPPAIVSDDFDGKLPGDSGSSVTIGDDDPTIGRAKVDADEAPTVARPAVSAPPVRPASPPARTELLNTAGRRAQPKHHVAPPTPVGLGLSVAAGLVGAFLFGSVVHHARRGPAPEVHATPAVLTSGRVDRPIAAPPPPVTPSPTLAIAPAPPVASGPHFVVIPAPEAGPTAAPSAPDMAFTIAPDPPPRTHASTSHSTTGHRPPHHGHSHHAGNGAPILGVP